MYFCEHIIPVLEQLGARLTSLREQPPTPSLQGDFNAGLSVMKTAKTFSLQLMQLSEDKNISHLATAPQKLSEHMQGFGHFMVKKTHLSRSFHFC
jgi:hypothetical protein